VTIFGCNGAPRASLSDISGKAVRIYVYVLKHDSGFAPNPFHGWCTLACCKPAIRSKARPGDWVVGITPRDLDNRLAYAMKVDESLTFEQYWSDRRFKAKRPRWKTKGVKHCGDNCYEPLGNGKFRQLPSNHHDHKNACENQQAKKTDLDGKRVVVGRRFCVTFKRPERYNRVNFTDKEMSQLLEFLESLPQGIQGPPRSWPSDDKSWSKGTKCG
jgi:hypothetical protein